MAELVLLAGAENDFFETYVRLELLSEELAVRFSLHVDNVFKRLEQFPESGAVFRSQTRRILVPGFPMGIFYCVEGQRIIVQAILDLRQSPEGILKRLS